MVFVIGKKKKDDSKNDNYLKNSGIPPIFWSAVVKVWVIRPTLWR